MAFQCKICGNDTYELGHMHCNALAHFSIKLNDIRTSNPQVYTQICLKCGGMILYVKPDELKEYLDKVKK